MEWSKVDAGLAGALAEEDTDGSFVVFVHLAADADPDVLREAGIEAVGSGSILTATVTAGEVERLTEVAGVRQLRLSRPLGPAGRG